MFRRQALALFEQLHARGNLLRLADRRALWPVNSHALMEAARVWPDILPLRPRTIIDVGAHRGAVAEQLSRLYRPAFMGLVEPLPQMAELLRAGRFAPRQKVFDSALGRSEGDARLHILASAPSSSLLDVAPGCDELFGRPMDTVQEIPVRIRTLDDIVAECELDHLDLLKVDVQGYEMEVFAGGEEALQKTRLIVSEVSFFEHYLGQPLFKAVYSHLNDRGFELRAMFGQLYDGQGIPLQCDAVFINRRL
jgi:FkbM family methyltransferase